MSKVSEAFLAVSENIDEALEQLVDQVGGVRATYRDHDRQLGVMNQSVQSVRTEVIERIDRLEVTVLTQFEQIQAQLQSLAMKLSMNGSGHG